MDGLPASGTRSAVYPAGLQAMTLVKSQQTTTACSSMMCSLWQHWASSITGGTRHPARESNAQQHPARACKLQHAAAEIPAGQRKRSVG